MDADDELGLRVVSPERVVQVDARRSLQPHSVAPLEVDEQQPNVRIHEHVAGGQVHAVAVVVREDQCVGIQHADKARLAALVRARRSSLAVGGCKEEHVATLDEGTVTLADGVADEQVVDTVGQRSRVEAVLQRAAAVVVPGSHGPS